MAEVRLPVRALKGRGVSFQQPHRFLSEARQPFDDGWGTVDEGSGAYAAPVPTTVTW